MDVFSLSRTWFNWCFDNPEKINPNHSALYFFCIEHCNRLGWKEKFGLPSSMAKEAIGIKNFRTYTNTLNELVGFGFIKLIEKSKNQYSSNIIAIVENAKAPTKALDKALQKHTTKQVQSIVSIDIQETIKQETISFDFFWNLYDKKIGDKFKIQKKWDKLSETDKEKIIKYIPKYKLAQPDKKFRKNIETFLNNKSWNDEVLGLKNSEPEEIPDYIQKQLDLITAR